MIRHGIKQRFIINREGQTLSQDTNSTATIKICFKLLSFLSLLLSLLLLLFLFFLITINIIIEINNTIQCKKSNNNIYNK